MIRDRIKISYWWIERLYMQENRNRKIDYNSTESKSKENVMNNNKKNYLSYQAKRRPESYAVLMFLPSVAKP